MPEDTTSLSDLRDWSQEALGWLQNHGPELLLRLAAALFILLIAYIVARLTRRVVSRATRRTEMSGLLENFFVSISGKLVLLLGFLLALAQLGVELGPLLAGLGVAGFIIGFATQDTLSNLAAGLMLLIHRPFDVGHVVEAGGVTGKVRDLNLVATTILTADNQRIVVPNSKIWGDVIKNITAEPTRRIDFTFGIGYDDDVEHAERVLSDIVETHELVLDEPAPTIKLHNLGDSTVDFIVRPWVNAEDYWAVYWDVTREVKRRFDAEGISIPYPQRDVHVHKVETT